MEEETALSDLQRADAVQRDSEEHSVLMPPKGHPQYSVLPPAHLPRPTYWPVVLAFGIVFSDPAPLTWTGVAANTAAWLRRDGQTDFVAFSVYCSHLGCPVDWLSDANLFLCPCHGGVYYKDGSVAAGPPPQPLTKYPVR